MLDFGKEYFNVKKLNPSLFEYFPEDYFEGSHAPLINVEINIVASDGHKAEKVERKLSIT